MSRKKGIIFDMDGVLYDTERIYQECWAQTAFDLTGREEKTFPMAMCGSSGVTGRKIIHEYFPEVDVEDFMDHCYAMYGESIARDLPEKPGVREILSYLQERGYKIAIASGSPASVIQSNLERSGIESYFDALVGGDEVADGKPAPDIFLKAAEKIGLDPADCYVFEDGRNGLLGARAAGCSPVMIVDMTRPDQELKKICTAIFNSLVSAKMALEAGLL